MPEQRNIFGAQLWGDDGRREENLRRVQAHAPVVGADGGPHLLLLLEVDPLGLEGAPAVHRDHGGLRGQRRAGADRGNIGECHEKNLLS
jgi:hypothetical protein